MDFSISKDKRASTSVETRPGTCLRISTPKLTYYGQEEHCLTTKKTAMFPPGNYGTRYSIGSYQESMVAGTYVLRVLGAQIY